jgi:hypothetical protein
LSHSIISNFGVCQFRSIIGSLIYLCVSRLDMMLSVCMCEKIQAAPKECHLIAVKRIMRYLVLTPNLSLWYPKDSHFDLIDYSDVNYVGCKVDRKWTSGTCQFLGRSLGTCLSTIEAKYVATGSCAQLLWMQQTLKYYGYTMNQIPLLYDNESTIKFLTTLVSIVKQNT